jgi:hypothetical protein
VNGFLGNAMRGTALATIVLASTALAAEAEIWRKAGDWTIMFNSADESGCYASRTMEDGSEVQIGAEPSVQSGYFAIYNPEWTHIQDDAVGFVEFDFGNSRFGGDAVGRIKNGVPGGYALFDNPAFLEAFAKGQTVKVSGRSGAVFNMDLTGTSKAVKEVLACQAAQK